MIRFKSSWLSRTWQRKVFTKSHHVWKPDVEIWKFKWTLVIFHDFADEKHDVFIVVCFHLPIKSASVVSCPKSIVVMYFILAEQSIKPYETISEATKIAPKSIYRTTEKLSPCFPMFLVFSSARLSFTAENTDLTQTSQGRKGLMNAIKGECFFWKVLSFCVSESFQQGLKDQMHTLATNWRSYCGSDCVMKMQLPRFISGRTAPSRSNRCFLAQIRQAFHVLT